MMRVPACIPMLAAVLFASTASAHAQTVTGRALDHDGQPLAGATIRLGEVTVTSGADGRFSIDSSRIAHQAPETYADVNGVPILRISAADELEHAVFVTAAALGDIQCPRSLPSERSEQFRGRYLRRGIAIPDSKQSITVILPENGKVMPGRPWVLHCHFFFVPSSNDHFSTDMLNRGFAYVHIGSWFGSPENTQTYSKAYEMLVRQHGFHPRPIVVGLSKGGHAATAWAIANPNRLSALYLDCAVLSVSNRDSWPFGPGGGEKRYLDEVVRYCGDREAALAWNGNPVDNVAPLARHKLPIISVYGTKDNKVIPASNILLLRDRLNAMGQQITLLDKPGAGHSHGVGGKEYDMLIDYLLKHTRVAHVDIGEAAKDEHPQQDKTRGSDVPPQR